jgi:hypothetical protein
MHQRPGAVMIGQQASTEFRAHKRNRYTSTKSTTIKQRPPTTTTTASVSVKMSATLEATRPASQKKTFGKSTREVPHHSVKAKKWYPAEDEVQPKKVGS